MGTWKLTELSDDKFVSTSINMDSCACNFVQINIHAAWNFQKKCNSWLFRITVDEFYFYPKKTQFE